MKILLLAPHPFFEERGTPIAVRLLLETLAAEGHVIDVLTYGVGRDVTIPGVTVHRIPRLPGVRSVRAGFSFKKILCDLFLAVRARRMARTGAYDVIHAVEESVFIARWLRRYARLGYVFDMDSSMPLQMTERFPFLRFALPVMEIFERKAVRGATLVVPMCESLAERAKRFGARDVVVLHDIPLLEPAAPGRAETLRFEWRVADICFLYVGNLEPYQGVDLLLDAYTRLLAVRTDTTLIIAGGPQSVAARCRRRAEAAGIGRFVHFLGPWPFQKLGELLETATVLVSPRLYGTNTPMKIYSYLASGKAILATRITAHMQVLTPEVAMIRVPEARALAEGMERLAENPALRATLGRNAQALVRERYCLSAFRERIVGAYRRMGAR